MESQTETNTVDVSEEQLPDWLVGVIVVIVLLVMAVIILIITTFIKNRSKSRSNVFPPTTACDDLESGKIGHNLDSTMMTSLTSLSHSINDSTLLSHSVSAEYDPQIPSPTNTDVIYGVLGCRNPLFVDDEVGPDERNNNDTSPTVDGELRCVDYVSDSDSIQELSDSSGCLDYDSTGRHGSQTMYVRKTSFFRTKIKQTGQTDDLCASERDNWEVNVLETNVQSEWETNKPGTSDGTVCSLGKEKGDNFQEIAECQDNQHASIADKNSEHDKNVPGCFIGKDQTVGSRLGLLSVTTGSDDKLSAPSKDMVTRCPQSGAGLIPRYDPRQDAHLVSSKKIHIITDELPRALTLPECGDGGERNEPSRPSTFQYPQDAGLVSDSDLYTESESWMCVETNCPDSETPRADLEDESPSSGLVQARTASGKQSLDVTSTSAEGNRPISVVVSTLAVPATVAAMPTSVSAASTPAIDVPTPGVDVPTLAKDVPTLAKDVPTPDVGVPKPAVYVPTATVDEPRPAVDLPSPAVNLPTPAVDVSTPAVDVPTPAVDVPTQDASVLRQTVTVSNFTDTNSTTIPSQAAEESTQDVHTQIKQEAADCIRLSENDKYNGDNGLNENKELINDISAVQSSPATVGIVKGKDRGLDPGSSKDLVASDDVSLQTTVVGKSGSGTEEDCQQLKGCTDLFNVHL